MHANVLHEMGISDHAPLFVSVGPKKRRASNELPISPDVFRVPLFREVFDKFITRFTLSEETTWEARPSFEPVSYTHLTLPTSDLV